MEPAMVLRGWNPLHGPSPCLFSVPFRVTRRCSSFRTIRALADMGTSAGGGGQLTARERRQLRNERRESRAGDANWREEVEERLLHKPKKRYASWMEELNLDNLADDGPQWWTVRVHRVRSHEISERLARSLAKNFPAMDFKVYYPSVRENRKQKNGSFTTKLKPLFPGCVFLHCLLNKELHDFIRECDGVGGFVGSRVGNTKRQINRPRPIPADDVEAIIQQANEEQELADQAFKKGEEQNISSKADFMGNGDSSSNIKLVRQSRKKGSKPSKSSSTEDRGNSLSPGVNVRILSGPFNEFTGRLKELNRKTGKASIGLLLFGKDSYVDLDVDQIAVEMI